MARTKKVVKEVKVIDEIKYICTMCGEEKNERNYYASSSMLYSNNKKLPICKNCVIKLYDILKSKYNTDIKSVYKCCESLDVCYQRGIYDSAVKQCGKGKNKELIAVYFKKAN